MNPGLGLNIFFRIDQMDNKKKNVQTVVFEFVCLKYLNGKPERGQ